MSHAGNEKEYREQPSRNVFCFQPVPFLGTVPFSALFLFFPFLLFPLNGGGGLTGDVVADAVNSADFINDPV